MAGKAGTAAKRVAALELLPLTAKEFALPPPWRLGRDV